MNITVNRAVIEQALEALERHLWLIEDFGGKEELNRQHEAITALRTALEQPTRSKKMADAGFMPRDTRLTCDECGRQFTRQILPVHKCTALEQPEQEPVREVWCGCGDSIMPDSGAKCGNCLAAEAHLPLTDEEIQSIWKNTFESGASPNTFARAIEAAHNIKE